MRSLFARLRDTFRRGTLDRELDDEIATHLELAASEMQARGMTRDDAQRAALKGFGGLSQTKEAEREVRSFPVLESVWTVTRDAVRMLWKQPRFSVVAIFTLALGIGATTAVYSVVQGVLLKPLPFRDSERLVALYHVTPASQRDFQGAASYFTYREQGRVFDDIGLWNSANVATIRNGAPEQLWALRVTEGTLPLLGVGPELGRVIAKGDDLPGAPLVAVLTHAYWQQAFGSSRNIVGQSLVINGAPCEIIGVLPASFKFLNTDPQLILPMRLDRATTRTLPFSSNGVARLKPGVTLVQANDDIARMIPLMVKQFPLMPGVTQQMWDGVNLTSNVRPLSEVVIGDLSRPLWILLGMAGIVLVMAWTNVANLLLVRAEKRQRELTVRGALGASRGRIAMTLLAESLVLGLSGGALGVPFALAGVAFLGRMAPAALPRLSDMSIDAGVLLVTLGTSMATSLLFGLVPVMRCRVFGAALLKASNRSSTDSPGRHRTQNTLVVAQIALAVVLLTVSGLMARTLITMRQVQPGFARPAEVETFEVTLPATLVADAKQVMPIYEQISHRLQQIPGVATVGVGFVTLDGRAGKGPLFVEGVDGAALPPIRSQWVVGPGYFEAMGTPVVAGRTVTWSDTLQQRSLVVISENLALEYWDPPAKAIGHRVRPVTNEPWQEIVGVVGNVRADGLNHPPPKMVYLAVAREQTVSRNVMYLVRSGRAGTASFRRELEQAVWSVNGRVPLANLRTLAEIQAASMAQTSFATVMLALAASVALLLALVGVYSVLSHIVAERTGEIGIRMALGAQIGDIRRLFLRYGLTLTIVGVAAGMGAAMLMAPVTSALLYGVSPVDPVTYAIVSIALAGAALLAMYLPTRRASRVEPVIALRSRV